MKLLSKVRYAFDVAYRGERIGMKYAANSEESSLKTVIETISEGIALYAAYSEIPGKVLEFLPIPQPQIWGKVLASSLGILLCGYILFSRKKEDRNTFTYAKVPRVVSGIIIWLLMLALVISIHALLFPLKPFVGPYSSSFEIPKTDWQLAGTEGKGPSEVRVYSSQIKIPPDKKEKYKHLKVFVQPYKGFKLEDVQPQSEAGRAAEKRQEPSELGKFEHTRSEWLFPFFEEEMQWRLYIKIGKADSTIPFPKTAPLGCTVFFHGD